MQIRKKHGKAELVLLDHGLYKRITDDFRRAPPPTPVCHTEGSLPEFVHLE